MKLGKLIYNDESGEARIRFNKKFINNFYGYEQLDVIKDLQNDLNEWYETIMESEVMQGDEIASRAYEDDFDEDAEYGPPIN
tara:strand:- start:446 stop:691 length:246 start_codon:yes stop_codon:yes gene_type:complete